MTPPGLSNPEATTDSSEGASPTETPSPAHYIPRKPPALGGMRTLATASELRRFRIPTGTHPPARWGNPRSEFPAKTLINNVKRWGATHQPGSASRNNLANLAAANALQQSSAARPEGNDQ